MRRRDEDAIPVVDLFAGPGGLGEGFSRYGERTPRRRFRVSLSIERDICAHQTLQLRSFVRQFMSARLPDEYYAFVRQEVSEQELFSQFPDQAAAASNEAWHVELGGRDVPHEVIRQRIADVVGHEDSWVLIGGPPCQAYSVAGRSRNRGIEGYRLERDERHRLYEEYLRIVADHWPPVFVMENVKGLLSTTIRDRVLFERICGDLRDPARIGQRRSRFRYRILSLEARAERTLFDDESVSRFVVRAEEHGVPQCRHRVILLGIRDDLGDVTPAVLQRSGPIPARCVLQGLPRLRSGLSRTRGRLSKSADSADTWRDALQRELNSRWVDGNATIEKREMVCARIVRTIQRLRIPFADRGGEFVAGEVSVGYRPRWFLDARIGGACNHAARVHMDRDLHRYLFAACFGVVNRRTPKLRDFPPDLLPDHSNVGKALNGGFFNDRFRVQLFHEPATTITSHIHKDGHYYIHPDPSQCRTLTVREAARLQTFPDNYFFMGPRTQQYVQVGNAVPPLLARQIAGVVYGVLVQAGMIR